MASIRVEETKGDGSIIVTTTITEEKRLSAAIGAIDHETRVVPRGAYRKVGVKAAHVQGNEGDRQGGGERYGGEKQTGRNIARGCGNRTCSQMNDFHPSPLSPASSSFSNGADACRSD